MFMEGTCCTCCCCRTWLIHLIQAKAGEIVKIIARSMVVGSIRGRQRRQRRRRNRIVLGHFGCFVRSFVLSFLFVYLIRLLLATTNNNAADWVVSRLAHQTRHSRKTTRQRQGNDKARQRPAMPCHRSILSGGVAPSNDLMRWCSLYHCPLFKTGATSKFLRSLDHHHEKKRERGSSGNDTRTIS